MVSDFAYNETTSIYELLDSTVNELSNVVYSDNMDLNATIPGSISLTSTLQGSPTLTAEVTLLNSIGIELIKR